MRGHWRDLANTTRRQMRHENGVIFPYMDVAMPFSRRCRLVVFAKSLLISLTFANSIYSIQKETFPLIRTLLLLGHHRDVIPDTAGHGNWFTHFVNA